MEKQFLASSTNPFSWWLYAIVIVGALLMATGGVFALVHPAMLVSPADQITGAVRIYAGYLVSRNIALSAMLLLMLGKKARIALSTLMVLTGFIQLLDIGLDFMEGRWVLVPGVLIFAVAFFVGAAQLSGRLFWKPAA